MLLNSNTLLHKRPFLSIGWGLRRCQRLLSMAQHQYFVKKIKKQPCLNVGSNAIALGGERGICKERQRRNSEPAERHGLLPITTCNKLAGTPKRRKQKAAHLVWTACVCDQYGVACYGGERGI